MRKPAWRLSAVLVLIVALSSGVLLISGCGSPGPGAVTEQFIKHMNDRKFGDAYDMLASESPARRGSRDDFVSDSEANFPESLKFEDIKIIEEKIDNDRATVKWSAISRQPDTPDENTEQELSLINQDGDWKVWE